MIFYDHLANPALLDLAPPHCEKISVGKQPYGPAVTQERIHELIGERAASGGKIVRLKGGDPFIFGRGFEELLFARELGMTVTYIPGISSMQASGLSDIPLTHRAVSESIWIVTGTRKDGAALLSDDLRLALKSRATVVIYMGMNKLEEIARLYRQEGHGEMPAAIIRHASLPEQQIAIGMAGQLPQLAAAHQLTHPAIILIGQVVGIGQTAQGTGQAAGAAGLKQEGYRTPSLCIDQELSVAFAPALRHKAII